MADSYSGREKREFFRYTHEKPIQYKTVSQMDDKHTVSKLMDAVSKNLSVSGILFTSKYIPELSSILVLDLDYRTTRICQEIEERALILNNKLLGKVVRIEDVDNGLYNIGVAFIKKDDKLPDNIKTLIT